MPGSVDPLFRNLNLNLNLLASITLAVYISPASARILPDVAETRVRNIINNDSNNILDNHNLLPRQPSAEEHHSWLSPRNATRDPRLLPAQISGIVGAYIFSVCVVGALLLALSRRRRERIAGIQKAPEIEMVTGHYGPSPISPTTGPRNFSWPSPDTKDPAPYIFPNSVRHSSAKSLPRSPPGYGDPYVDTRVVEADREMLNRDLEDIYAHVMEQEAAKAAGVKLTEMPLPVPLQTVGPVPPPAPQRQASPPKKLEKKTEKNRPANLALWEPESPKPQSRTSSIISALRSPRKKSSRAMRISSPIPTPISATFPSGHASDEEPLSPRYYKPPPPPPVPRDQAPYTHSRNHSQGPSPISPTRSIAEQLNAYPPAVSVSTRYHHQANRSQASMHSQASTADPMSATSATSQTPLVPPSFPLASPRPRPANGPTTSHPPPPPLVVPTLTPAPAPSSTNSSTRALPLRQFEPALASPSFQQTTRTTVLERTNPLSPALRTGGLPWSPGAVPYSPYQPFSPMVPITPTLVTKEQRKKMKKMEPRTPVVEMVRSEDELWDNGY